MPFTRIETRKGWIGQRRAKLLEAVQRALETGLKIPSNDRCVVLDEHDEDAFLVPPGRGPGYMVIAVTLFLGRSLDAKRRLYRAIVDELAPFGVTPFDIKVVLVESAPENWGIGGRPASEIELGFEIKV